MLRLTKPQLELWDTVLPEVVRRLPEELAFVDRYLDDDRFMEPFRARFAKVKTGRPTIPVEQILRLMFLKKRYGMGYAVLMREVSDSIHWRRFCRIPLSEKVPHPTALSKSVRRYGAKLIDEVDDALVLKMREGKLIKGGKLRSDTTVIDADIKHPTDSGLLADGIRLITRTVKRLGELKDGLVEGFRDRSRTVKKHMRALGTYLKGGGKTVQEKADEVTKELAGIAEGVVEAAGKVLRKTDAFIKRAGADAALVAEGLRAELEDVKAVTARVIDQAKQRFAGVKSIPDRLVSFFDRDARPIVRGLAKKRVEFGHKIRITEAEGGVITERELLYGNVSDAHQAVPAVEHHIALFGTPPREAAFDRGFFSRQNEETLKEMGVERVSICSRGKASPARKAHEKQSWHRRLQNWRAGGEATISRLKRCCRIGRSLFRGHEGVDVWSAFGVLAHNLVRAHVLSTRKAAARARRSAARGRPEQAPGLSGQLPDSAGLADARPPACPGGLTPAAMAGVGGNPGGLWTPARA